MVSVDNHYTSSAMSYRLIMNHLQEALQSKIGTLSLEAQAKLEKDTAKKEAKAEAKADAALKKKMVCLRLTG
jgi:vacuolar-type H+-ATPase subunit E/Vma4